MTSLRKYIYGPVYSWRMGMSLGIDPVADHEKICNLDCVYCQLGRTKTLTENRAIFVKTAELIEEIKAIPAGTKVDYLTFSGRGEPTLALNLGAMIHTLKKVRPEPVAVITNSTLLHQKDVCLDLQQADYVLAKLDVGTQQCFEKIDVPGSVNFSKIIDGLLQFREMYTGQFALQIMLMEENFDQVIDLSHIARLIDPDEVQLNTPTRPCGIQPLDAAKIEEAKSYFNGLQVSGVYDKPVKPYEPWDAVATKRRHGNYVRKRF